MCRPGTMITSRAYAVVDEDVVRCGATVRDPYDPCMQRAPGRSGRSNGRTSAPKGGRRALVLGGGGITGVTYEIGALRALDDLLVAPSVNDSAIYVGTTAGSIAAA